MKKCFKCGKEKSYSEFYKHSAMADGYLGKCKECAKKDTIEYRKNNLEYCRNHDRIRSKTEARRKTNRLSSKRERAEHPERVNARNKKYKDKNPLRVRAMNMLARALRRGVIRKSNFCECCYAFGKTEAHHDDYDKPIDVKWLCVKCHNKRHVEIRSEDIG